MELTGRIDDLHQFICDSEDGELPCVLYVTAEDDDGEPEEFDLSDLPVGPVIVSCESFDGDDAWGVSEVIPDEDEDDDDDDDDDDDVNDEDAFDDRDD
jgi:hypothetical protein